MSFFHTTPHGRIINRLTKDTADVDKNLADFAGFFIRSCLQLASTVVLIGAVVPFALPALIPILLAFYFMYQYFQVGAVRWPWGERGGRRGSARNLHSGGEEGGLQGSVMRRASHVRGQTVGPEKEMSEQNETLVA